MKELFKIFGEYTYNSDEFYEDQVWNGYILVDQDFWFEGIVEDEESRELGPRYICGSLIKNEGIQLVKLINDSMYAPVSYSGINKGNYIDCVWNFLVESIQIDSFQNLSCALKIRNGGLGRVIIGPKLNDLIMYDKVVEEIEQWKNENESEINKEIIEGMLSNKENLEKQAFENIMKKKAEEFKRQRKPGSEDYPQFYGD